MVSFSLCQSISCRRLATISLNALESRLSAKHPIGTNRSEVREEQDKLSSKLDDIFSTLHPSVAPAHSFLYNNLYFCLRLNIFLLNGLESALHVIWNCVCMKALLNT